MLKGLRTGIIVRVAILFAVVCFAAYLIANTNYYVSIGLLGLIIIFLMINLIRYVEVTNKNLERFVDAISYNDFSQTFSESSQGKSLDSLNEVFNKIIEKFKNERQRSEESYLYLQTVVQHIGIGVFSFNSSGEVELFNNAAKKILGIPFLRKIEELNNLSGTLFKTVKDLKSGSQSLIRFQVDNRDIQLAVYATEFRARGDYYKIISLSNISSELEEKEMEAWQNLTQVLAHEIMNSITPISSLSDTVNSMISGALNNESENEISDETLEDVRQALSTINKRSLGLMRFVESYRNITQLPTPNFSIVPLSEVVSRVKNLMKGEASTREIEVKIEEEVPEVEVKADAELIEQSLINVTKNAFKALKGIENGKVTFRIGIDDAGHAYVDIEDNGPGVSDAAADKIFVPFYTTSKNSAEGGSGIGLSLSRQIMRMHDGSLFLLETKAGKTVFRLRF